MGIVTVVYEDGDRETVSSIIREGRAYVELSNGDTFRGNYVRENGRLVKSGDGSYTWNSGSRYDGGYKSDQRHGYGVYIYSNGVEFRGNWVNGARSGRGVEIFTNGDVFEGTFEDDRKSGKGVYTYANGAVLEGTWDQGVFKDGVWQMGNRRLSSDRLLAKLGKRASEFRKSISRRFSTKKRPLGVIIAGAPASGKGTQCEVIREQHGLIHFSSGDMLRSAVASGSEIGLKCKELMESGQLVPDEIVIAAVKERLEQDDVKENGFLLDGFPRTGVQAKALQDLGIKVDAFLLLHVPEKDLIERVIGRRIDPETGNSYHVKFNPPPKEIEDRIITREDDTEEKVKIRLEAYNENIGAIKDFYTDKTYEITGTKPKQEISREIHTILEGLKQ